MAERIRLSRKQRKKVSDHIRELCCNYDCGNCIALDDGDYVKCVQQHSRSLLCRWYINAVLPANTELEAELYKIVADKFCKQCGKPVFSNNNATKYCPECASVRRRKKEAERQRKRYARLRKTDF